MALYPDTITLSTGETIPLSALEFSTSRSGGPGGQNVNKVETKVDVRFVIAGSPWIAENTQRILLEKLSARIDTSGAIRISSSIMRTQGGNRSAVIARLERLLNEALVPEKPRVATKPTYGSKQRRVEVKRRISQKKSSRNWREED